MLYVHQVHSARPDAWDELLRRVREDLVPGLAAHTSSRMVWCAQPMDAGIRQRELITIMALTDAEALDELRACLTVGELNPLAMSIAGCRLGSQTRLLKPLAFNPFQIEDLDSVPLDQSNAITHAYMHDFVRPRIGRRRFYEEGMRQVYAAMTEDDLASVVLWLSLEPVPGGGPFPEQVNISRIQNTDALVTLLEHDVARDNPAITEWMKKGLQMRDTWTTRLVRALPWSPLS